MLSTELLEDRELTLLAHRLLNDIDPTRWRPERAPTQRANLQEVAGRMANHRRLAPLKEALEHEVPAATTGAPEQRSRWMAFKQHVQPVYARVAASLRDEAVHVPALRPTNHARSLMHVGAAGGALLAIVLSPPPVLPWLAFAFCAFAWSMEAARRLDPRVNALLMKVFGVVAHAHEHQRVNSATWYATALVLLAALATPLQAAVGVVVLGVGDPVAGYVGRRFGRLRLRNGRSLEGSLGFAVSATAAALATVLLFSHGALGPGAALAVAAAASVVGAVVELLSRRLDDNFTIPLSAAVGAALAQALLGALQGL